MRIAVSSIALACLLMEGCAREGQCIRDALHTLEVSAPIPEPEIRWALAVGACDHTIPPLLLASLAQQESTLDPKAIGPKGARGLLQIRPGTARELAAESGLEWKGADSLFDPHLNAQLGAAYLRSLYESFGGWEPALSAYNLGPSWLRRRIERGEGTSSPYARAVLARWALWGDGPVEVEQ